MSKRETVSVTSTCGLWRGMVVLIDGEEPLRISDVGAHEFTVKPLRWWHRAWMWVRRTWRTTKEAICSGS